MKIYGEQIKYNVHDGKPHTVRTVVDILCDYTGLPIDNYDDYMEYNLGYLNGHDECFGTGKYERFLLDNDMDYYAVMDGPYHFKQDDEICAEAEMLRELNKEDIGDYTSFSSLMRDARAKTIKRLIDEGKYKPQDFQQDEIET